MIPQRILITGATGFVGSRLLPVLRNAYPQTQITGTYSAVSVPPAGGLADASGGLYACDLACRDQVIQTVADIVPDCVINLAAISHVPTAIAEPDQTWQVNLQGSRYLLDALIQQAQPCVFIQVGSGDCYGAAFRSGHALTEDAPFMPLNPYAASKAAADLAAFASSTSAAVKVIRARPFNHSAGGQSAQFVIPAFADQIARIEAGLQPPVMEVGNLDAQRCFLHLDDVISAYQLLIEHADGIDSGAAFNIVSDAPVAIAEILRRLLALSSVHIEVRQAAERQRPSDIPVAQGDASKLKRQTGWEPRLGLDDILADVLAYSRYQYR